MAKVHEGGDGEDRQAYEEEMSKQYATAPKSNKRTVNIATYSVKKDLEKTLEAHWFYPFCESVFDAAIVQYKKDKAEGIAVVVANSGQIIRAEVQHDLFRKAW